jgi:hypothetical protein
MADIADVTGERMEVQEAADIAEIRRKAADIAERCSWHLRTLRRIFLAIGWWGLRAMP